MTHSCSLNLDTVSFLSASAQQLPASVDYSAVPALVCDKSRLLAEVLSSGAEVGRAGGIIV